MILAGLPAMVALAGIAVWVLLSTGPDSAQLDAIRTGGTLGVGLGGAVALWLAVRRQRSAELDLVQKHESHRLAEQVASDNRAYQLRTVEDAREDALARRVTEQYGKAVDQLGSERAPVRLGGLYALERLGQDHADPRLRQMIADVTCAYLRMPADGSVEEAQVRRTAQQIIANHSRPGDDRQWPGLQLDLTGAQLDQADFDHCHFDQILFTRTTFTGIASFAGTLFATRAGFIGAQFQGAADLSGAKFAEEADFRGAECSDTADFSSARFAGARFDSAIFGEAKFDHAQFFGATSFTSTQFAGRATFRQTEFRTSVTFENAKFQNDVSLHGARFADLTSFAWAVFRRYAGFRETVFSVRASFADAQFGHDVDFDAADCPGGADLSRAQARVDHAVAVLHRWPPGWTAGDPENGWAPLIPDR